MSNKVYTKTGDDGTTGLFGGTRVPKYELRIEAYGTVDELNSYIGLVRDHLTDKHYVDFLIGVQDRLFTVGAILASQPGKKKLKIPELSPTDITRLENEIDKMEETLLPMKNFLLPGGHPIVSFIHISRCICRRAERLVVHLHSKTELNPLIIQYINRLSDYLFVLARKQAMDLKITEIPWKPRI